jgi:hypothetical protein
VLLLLLLLSRLPADKMMPSFASLRDFGNTSSASTWYTWGYIEATTGVKRGERVLQVSSGFMTAHGSQRLTALVVLCTEL